MASKASALGILVVALALTLPLTGCTGGSAKEGEPTTPIPTPGIGKVAAFNMTAERGANRAADNVLTGQVTSDRAGNVYMVSSNPGTDDTIVRLSPSGVATSFPVPGPASSHSGRQVAGLATAPDGELVVGVGDNLYQVTPNGQTKEAFKAPSSSPNPLGVLPNGAIIFEAGGSVYSLSDGASTLLYRKSADDQRNIQLNAGRYRGAVDASGTAYVAVGAHLTDVVVIPPGGPAHRWDLRGNVPGTSVPLPSLVPVTLASAHDGSVYVIAFGGGLSPGEGFLLSIKNGMTKLLARGSFRGPGHSCQPGEQYPALNNPCTLPWFVTQSGDRVLLLGAHNADGSSVVPLALRADRE